MGVVPVTRLAWDRIQKEQVVVYTGGAIASIVSQFGVREIGRFLGSVRVGLAILPDALLHFGNFPKCLGLPRHRVTVLGETPTCSAITSSVRPRP